MKFLLFFITFLATDCNNTDDIVTQEVEKKALETLAKEIKTIADTSICSSEFTCDYVGFGSKPCGGNWEYLVYSNSIDVVDFLAKVKTYNELEKKYNIKYGIMSDCMVVPPPNKIICENGKCKAIYN
ncbi:MAG: hypothetical protein GQ552_00885 [Flavobacteriaceae bacterium]|nr:hypothetical protein [Flavobacteriaceae bacterium]